MIPKTAGRHVTEEELRAYFKCSQFHFYGGETTLSPFASLIQYAYERLTIHQLRQGEYDHMFWTNRYLLSGVKDLKLDEMYLEPQLQELRRQGTYALNKIYKAVPRRKYIPVVGPWDYDIKVSKTPIRLHVSALLRSLRNKTIHIISFSPYTRSQDVLNDPTIHLRIHTLQDLVPEWKSRPQAHIHLFYADTKNNLQYQNINSNIGTSDYIPHITRQIRLMEYGVHYPVLPCSFTCQYKNKCHPGGNINAGIRY